MITISFRRWSLAAGKVFVRERIYIQGWRWTPFVKLKLRKTKVKEWGYDPLIDIGPNRDGIVE